MYLALFECFQSSHRFFMSGCYQAFLVEEMEVGSGEVKRRIKYNRWALGLSNWMKYGVIYEMGKMRKEQVWRKRQEP